MTLPQILISSSDRVIGYQVVRIYRFASSNSLRQRLFRTTNTTTRLNQYTELCQGSIRLFNNHDCSVATCTTFPRPRQPVPAPASCDVSFGISESVLQMKFWSVSGIKSSLRGRAWKGGKPQERKSVREMMRVRERDGKQGVLSYPLKALVRRFPPSRLADNERWCRPE
jgi:hypothetical protein